MKINDILQEASDDSGPEYQQSLPLKAVAESQFQQAINWAIGKKL